MCGLFGYVGVDRAPTGRGIEALRTLAHRGPDQQGDWSDRRVYVGHRRLSILDLSERGRQPFISDDGSVVVAVNGEVYNFQELRQRLSSNYRFTTSGDSEVVLHGYREWGIVGLLSRLEGMYAFCIYDTRAGRVFLARDRVGIKPLYYSTRGECIAWASELKAIEAFLGGEQLDLDPTAIYDFLTYLYVPTPKTRYKDVFKLAPAHYAEIDVSKGRVTTHCYWQLSTESCTDSIDVAAERMRGMIGAAVRAQLCSDVPVGFFLSGGMDSSIVVLEAVQSGGPVHTYCVGFDDVRHDETRYARIVADRFRTQHQTRTLARDQIAPMFASLKSWFDEPFADTSAMPTYLVSQFARETCKVVLSGDGGDEVFGGYPAYNLFSRHVSDPSVLPRSCQPLVSSLRSRFRQSMIGKLANRIEFGLLNEMELYARLMGGLLKSQKRNHALELGIEPDYDDYWYFRKFYRPELPTITRLQYLDFHTYLPDDILTKVDRVSMAVSLEVRVPLLATEVVEYSFSLPENVRLYGGRSKGILRYAYRDILPTEIIERGKKGFGIPADSYARQIVEPGRSKQEAVLEDLYAIS